VRAPRARALRRRYGQDGKSLPERVKKALKDAKPKLPGSSAISDLAYVVDVNASGADALFVYIILKDNRHLTTLEKLDVENLLRDGLRAALDYDVYFRWRMAGEHREVLAMHGPVDRPVSALR
jgi:hypothetical protein